MTNVVKRLPGLPIERSLGVISGRWKAVIVYILLNGFRRTSELERHLPDITQKVLIQQLKALEEHGLVVRKTGGDTSRVEYGLTPLGMSLRPVLEMLEEWGLHHAEELHETERLLPCEAVVHDLERKETEASGSKGQRASESPRLSPGTNRF
ncbi:winged helix-turn-helix transcriptional regulator [Paraburkholderia hospita]|uniref:winged helix-turn-helix transcriptional regulator n=1 Tax=Paraburkholderia hospita TaxID=169430 RepID=UPI000B3470BB|nr:helix-turn-helix domain-containing protein [Paraburkholderia hospita]OUL96528.1 HxlR family transcriptional regulator [Paraburkholderia hospita]